MKYKHNEHLENKPTKIGKTSMVLALIVNPVVFTCVAIGLNSFLGQQTGFWLVGIGHLAVGFYYLSSLYVYNKSRVRSYLNIYKH
jgi:ABC-type spermidine/putrescine transport system permease subunit II